MAPFTWLAQPLGWLPEALRPGVFIALVVLVVWFVLVRRGVPDLWRASCRGVARLFDFGLGIVLRLEYTVTTARRHRGEAPSQWAFALAGVTDVLQDGAAWLYERHQTPVAEPVEHNEDGEPNPPPTPPRKPAVPWLLCAVIVLCCTAAWITMDRLAATSIAKYRLAQASDPWRDIEEWVDIDSGRGAQPELVHARRRHTVMRVRIACPGTDRCRGWVLLKAYSGAVVAAHYVALAHGSTLVELRLTRHQLRTAHGGRLVVVRV